MQKKPGSTITISVTLDAAAVLRVLGDLPDLAGSLGDFQKGVREGLTAARAPSRKKKRPRK